MGDPMGKRRLRRQSTDTHSEDHQEISKPTVRIESNQASRRAQKPDTAKDDRARGWKQRRQRSHSSAFVSRSAEDTPVSTDPQPLHRQAEKSQTDHKGRQTSTDSTQRSDGITVAPGVTAGSTGTIGDILETFFAEDSTEKLWVMSGKDEYTKIVRQWDPVINAVEKVKNDLASRCFAWRKHHRTSQSWKPSKTDPPDHDPNAYLEWVKSPPGTGPNKCAKEYAKFKGTGKETDALATCAIGSFGILATVNSIDCKKNTAELNIWMYNSMDKKSFGMGRFHPRFWGSGMKSQYMWWHWTESHSWQDSESDEKSDEKSGGNSGGWF